MGQGSIALPFVGRTGKLYCKAHQSEWGGGGTGANSTFNNIPDSKEDRWQ